MQDIPFISQTPEPPYYAVIFSSLRCDGDHGYGAMAVRMVELAKTMPGYLGMESVRNEGGQGITVSYWSSEEAIRQWKQNAEHLVAQGRGRDEWYKQFAVRVARVERAYGK